MEELDYKQLFESVKGELERLHEGKANLEDKLERVNDRIDAMSKSYNAIAPLVGERPIATVSDLFLPSNFAELKTAGISVAVRYILDSSPSVDFTASTVRDLLKEKGWDWSNYVNPLSTVHTVLTRLAASDAAERVVRDGKWVFYSSKRNPPKSPTAGRLILGSGGSVGSIGSMGFIGASIDPTTNVVSVDLNASPGLDLFTPGGGKKKQP